jgi:hypothetical protein
MAGRSARIKGMYDQAFEPLNQQYNNGVCEEGV